MKCWYQLIAVAIVSIASGPALSQSLLASETNLSFANGTTAGPSPVQKVILTTPVTEGGVEVLSLRWVGGAAAPFMVSQSRALPTVVYKSNPLALDFIFAPASLGTFSNALEIEYRYYSEPVSTVRVSVTGTAVCATADDNCEPIRPLCAIDRNLDKWVQQDVPSLKNEVFGALLTHTRAHSEAVSSYTLPGSFFYEVLGLSKLFSTPNQCCACGGAGCLPAIEFTRVKGQPAVAMFRWKIGSALAVSSIANPYKIEATISLPSEIRGKAIVKASGIEYVFAPSTLPRLEYRIDGKTWFLGAVQCIAPSREVVIRHASPTSQVPAKHLIFEATP